MREITPGPTAWGDGTRSYRIKDDAWPVAALQLNLNTFGNRLAVDGQFGPLTEKVAKAFQRHRKLVEDGIIGPVSQERMCRDLGEPEAKIMGLPGGLMRGIIENESSYMLACYSPHPSGEGFDLGVLQDAFYSDENQQDALYHALDIRGQAGEVARKLRARHDYYRARGASDRLAWECATMYHNRPASADRLAQGLPASTNNDPVAWVKSASGGRLHTIAEWCAAYIAKATKYVTWV